MTLRVLSGRNLLLIALLLRVGFAVTLPAHEFIPGPDQMLHDSLARNFLSGRGLSISEDIMHPPEDQPEWVKKKFERQRELGGLWGTIRPNVPQAAIPPLNPLALALSYYLLGMGNLFIYRLLMALLGTASCWFAFDIARRIFSERVALITLLLTAIHPALLYYTGVALTESIFIFFFLAFIDVIIRFRERPSLGLSAVAGAIWVLGLLTRSAMTTVLPFAILFMLFPRRGSFKPVAVAVFLLSIAVCLVPWVIRNYQVFDKLVIVPNKGWNLWERNNYRFNEAYQQETDEADAYAWILGRPPFKINKPETVEFPDILPSDDEVTRNEKFYAQGKAFILANPGLYIRLCVVHLFEFFRVLGRGHDSLVFTVARIFPYGIALPFFLVGFLQAFRRSDPASRQKIVLISIMLAYIALHILVTAAPRYRLPIEPLMLMFATAAMLRIWQRVRGREKGDPPSPRLWRTRREKGEDGTGD
ncbi:MAG: glycosyltransferase family 39 protein [Candidatus Coatesbacteria bacterium]|nr:glycosyltransferase family 39 protein [Candidatus Coatesbacteria bacterium]